MRTVGDTRIYHWSEIADSFRGADIFLGNGFSININPALNYRSLFDKFMTYMSLDAQAVFKKFDTTNFEAIQSKLSDAREVNSIFGNDVSKIAEALQQLKRGLIQSIKDLHPNFSTIDRQTLHRLSQELDWFGNIYTTNYDIFLYHIVLATIDRQRRAKTVKRIQDFFRTAGDTLSFNDQPLVGYRNIYYIHGALFLYNEGGLITKLRRGDKTDELLDLIRLNIHLGNIPIFVSEGKSDQKQPAISRSQYLSFCQEAFKASSNKTVIYGFSFSDTDDHLTGILNSNKRKLAIGLYLTGLSMGKILQNVRHIEKKLYRYSVNDLKYFDSGSLF